MAVGGLAMLISFRAGVGFKKIMHVHFHLEAISKVFLLHLNGPLKTFLIQICGYKQFGHFL